MTKTEKKDSMENEYKGKRWRVLKTVTEYHYFAIVADTQDEAIRIAEDNDGICYCDRDSADDTVVEVEFVRQLGRYERLDVPYIQEVKKNE